MSKFVSQNDWVDSIMEIVDNLEDDGKQELFDRLEADIYYREPTREDLKSKIQELESLSENLEDDVRDLEAENQILEDRIEDLQNEMEE